MLRRRGDLRRKFGRLPSRAVDRHCLERRDVRGRGRRRLYRAFAALQADALDFLGDAATYGLSLLVIGRPAAWRANAALFKGLSLGVLALWVGGSTLWRAILGGAPEPITMSAVGALALCVNVGAAMLLYRFRDGEANVRSMWLCSRNDAIGNIAVVFAAVVVWASGAAWPDLVVALAMSALFLQTSVRIVAQARGELRQVRSAPNFDAATPL